MNNIGHAQAIYPISASGIPDMPNIKAKLTLSQRAHVERIEHSLAEVLLRSDETRLPTQQIAEDLAREYLASAVQPVPLAAVG